ncbi:carboxypeptidase regulatory-like domain-containing protein [Horticoccus luteus]|uniref:Carboxypeptidase regulatory-like domain-containing protein n=1 Tax=Horticoccus luteus TaxID=2862869 RepID=A0A8F9XL75_9BACT|nr:SdrD B-like domain-containing protein [Horticoccus luteus]QYM78759.1 carboxypeptidase regulatory-like domain-containing protein [Horticoccus luteus]
MKLSSVRKFSSFRLTLLSVLACAAWIQATPVARAQDPDPTPVVGYTPSIVQIQDMLPFTRSYTFQLTSPWNHLVSTPVLFAVTPNGKPNGVTDAKALSYVTVSPAPLVFTSPNQSLTVTVTMQLPADAVAGSYGYKIVAVGWPEDPLLGLSNVGTFINATVTAAAQPLTPPQVSIATPANNSTVSVDISQMPVAVPFTFTAIGPGPNPSPVDSISYDVDGDAGSVTINSLATLNTLSVTGTGSILVTNPGQHVVTVRAHNAAGTATATNTFTVVTTGQDPATPPEVVINSPYDEQQFTVPYASLDAQGRASIPLTFTATASPTYPILHVDADVDGTPVNTLDNLRSPTVESGGTMLVKVGSHTVTAHANNSVDSAQDMNDFTVIVTDAPPPVVVIDTPADGTVKTFNVDDAPYIVPLHYTANSVAKGGAIRAVLAFLDGSDTPLDATVTGLDTPTATGAIDLSFTEAGQHTVSVTTMDDYGNASATSTFTINVVDPQPTITITAPTNGTVITLGWGCNSTNVAFKFVSGTSNGFTVDTVTGLLNGTTPVTISTNSPALGTAQSVTSTGTLYGLTAGSYTLTGTTTSSGKSATASISFTIQSRYVAPPTVVITSPAPNTTFSMTSGQCLSIPLTFTGTSNYSGGLINQLTAKLDGVALTVSPSSPNLKVANGTATMVVKTAGTHTIVVTAKDGVGTATATQTFNVVIVCPKKITGNVFYDVNANGKVDCRESGQANVTVKLTNASNQVIATTTTDRCGNYTFANVAPGTYTVTAVPTNGMKPTPSGDSGSRKVTVSTKDVCAPVIGLGLNFSCIRTMNAYCNTRDYWQCNVSNAVSGRDRNCQIPSKTLNNYTKWIACDDTPHRNISMKTACSNLGSRSSQCKDGLSQELLAAKYNFANGCYLNGDKDLTARFISWGDDTLNNCNSYSSSYVSNCRDWFSSYNKSRGCLNGPSS